MHAAKSKIHVFIKIFIYKYKSIYIYTETRQSGSPFRPPLKLEFEARIWRLNSARSS